MHQKIKLFLFSSLLAAGIQAQSRLGSMACVYVTTTDLDSSAALYGKLGFSVTGENSFPVSWKQVSDGSLVIMMRKENTPYMGLTYYTDNIDSLAGALQQQGIIFSQQPKPGDPIKRFYFKSPDGFSIMLAANLGGFKQPTGITMATMQAADYADATKFPNKVCGVFGEFCHPVKELNTSISFWKNIGFSVLYTTQSPYPHAILSDGLMIIGLHQTDHFDYPAITYFGIDVPTRIAGLKSAGLAAFSPLGGERNQVLRTFEGQHFFIFSMGM